MKDLREIRKIDTNRKKNLTHFPVTANTQASGALEIIKR